MSRKSKKSIIKTNLRLSMLFGILMGIIFPFYASLFVEFKSRALLVFFIAGCVIAGIAVGSIAFFITKITIIKIVKLISKELENIASGEGNLTHRINIESYDEVGILIKWFNLFIEKLDKMIIITKNNIKIANDGSGNLYSNVEHTAGTIKNIAESIESINNYSIEHNKEVLNTEDSLKRLDKTVLKIITFILELFSQMDFLTKIILSQADSINKMYVNIENLNDQISGADKDSLSSSSDSFINETESAVKNTQGSISKIIEIIEIIDDIYSKTNVLAINASIEAAHQDKIGKGFHVISSEMKNLASNAESQTKEILQHLNSIQKNLSESGERVKIEKVKFNDTVDVVKNTSDNLINNVEKIQEITGEVENNYNEMRKILLSVKENMEELKKNSMQCMESMNKLNELSEIIRKGVAEIHTGSQEINNTSNATLSVADKFNQTCSIIDEHINKYITSED